MRFYRVAVVIVIALAACKHPGSGSLRDVGYHVELPGSYSRVAYTEDREDVWVPSDDARPFVSIVLAPAPIMDGKITPCGANDDTVGTSAGGFIYVRDGSSVKLRMTNAPDGAAVHVSRCVPPGADSLGCMAAYADGKMSAERTAAASAICKSLKLR